MSLEQQIRNDMTQALKSGEKLKLNTLRTILAQLKDERIKLMHELADDEVITVLMRAVKSRKESVEMYRTAKRDDLVEKESSEIELIQQYLPSQMSEEEIKAAVMAIIKSAGVMDVKDIGKVMGPAMAQLKGKADGKLVQQIARSLLSN